MASLSQACCKVFETTFEVNASYAHVDAGGISVQARHLIPPLMLIGCVIKPK